MRSEYKYQTMKADRRRRKFDRRAKRLGISVMELWMRDLFKETALRRPNDTPDEEMHS